MSNQTTKHEIVDIITDIIEFILKLTIHPKDEEQVGIEVSKYRKQRILETRALLRINCRKKYVTKIFHQ